jgi:ABC-type uncharacterized transport system auxiliary subunit
MSSLSQQWGRGLLKTTFLILTAIGLSACAGVLESNKPAREVYLLQAPATSPVTPSPDAPRLVLSVFTVPGLDTDNIQVLHPNARLFPVANAHWPDNLPEVMSSLSRRALMDSGLFRSISMSTIARPGEWLLELELQAFYGLQDSSGATIAVLMQLEGNLRCEERTEVLRLESRKSVQSGSLPDLVAAHQQALNETLQALPERIQQACEP